MPCAFSRPRRLDLIVIFFFLDSLYRVMCLLYRVHHSLNKWSSISLLVKQFNSRIKSYETRATESCFQNHFQDFMWFLICWLKKMTCFKLLFCPEKILFHQRKSALLIHAHCFCFGKILFCWFCSFVLLNLLYHAFYCIDISLKYI